MSSLMSLTYLFLPSLSVILFTFLVDISERFAARQTLTLMAVSNLILYHIFLQITVVCLRYIYK